MDIDIHSDFAKLSGKLHQGPVCVESLPTNLRTEAHFMMDAGLVNTLMNPLGVTIIQKWSKTQRKLNYVFRGREDKVHLTGMALNS